LNERIVTVCAEDRKQRAVESKPVMCFWSKRTGPKDLNGEK